MGSLRGRSRKQLFQRRSDHQIKTLYTPFGCLDNIKSVTIAIDPGGSGDGKSSSTTKSVLRFLKKEGIDLNV